MSKFSRISAAKWFCTLALFAVGSMSFAQAPADWADLIKWRSIGPANMSGRITAIAVYEPDPSTFWLAAASGGILKTTNNGNSFTHQFDDQSTVSIGDVQVARSNPDIVWVGTGEANPRNSVSYGDGVYKSTDGGKTWTNMGLRGSFQIGRIAIHPTNPDVVYVGALGRLWGPNEERGLFKTNDGGKTWEKIHYINEMTGVIDVQMNPQNPEELIFATYERLRDNTDGNDPIKRHGEGSGIYKTSDGGKSFVKLTEGLPTCKLGRVGLSYFAANPQIIYAVVESEKTGKEPEKVAFLGFRSENADIGVRITDVTSDAPLSKAGVQSGDIILDVDGEFISNYSSLDTLIRSKAPGDKLNIRYVRDGKATTVEVELAQRPASGSARGRNPFDGSLGGQNENLQDQQGAEGFQHGGVYVTENGGTTWTRINSVNPRPMYYSQIRVDPVDRNNVYVLGTSLYRSKDGGKTFTADGGRGIHVDHHALWINPGNPKHMLIGNDGGYHITHDRMDTWDSPNSFAIGQFYHVSVDTRRDYRVYGGLQDNGSWAGPNRSGERPGPVNSDWFRVGGGDGFITLTDPEDPDQVYFESQNGGMGRIHLKTGERGFIRPRPPRGVTYRFNWKTPFLLSPHNSRIYYAAGNHVFRSWNKGDNLTAISPEITNANNGSASALSESPAQAGVIYVGTTCGALWMTQNGGQTWEPIYSVKAEAPTSEAQSAEASQGEPADRGTARGAGRGRGQRAPGEQRPTGERRPSGAGDAPAQPAETPPTTETVPSSAPSTLNGTWVLELQGSDVPLPPNFRSLEVELTLGTDNSVAGRLRTARGENELQGGKFNPETNELTFSVESRMGAMELKGKLEGEKMTGSFSIGDGRLTLDFTGTKKQEAGDDPNSMDSEELLDKLTADRSATLLVSFLTTTWQDTQDPPSLKGIWQCLIESEQLPDGRLEFEMEIKLNEKNNIAGKVVSMMGELAVNEGFFNIETKKFSFTGGNEQMNVDFEGILEGNTITGTASVGGEVQLPFKGSRTGSNTEKTEPPTEDAPVPQPPPAETAETKPAEQPAPAAETEKVTPQEPQTTSDLVSGKWTGTMSAERIPRGMGEFTMELKLDAQNNVTGETVSPRNTLGLNGKFNPESKSIEMTADSAQFSISYEGKIDGDKMTGTVSFGEQFSMDFEAKRTTPAATPVATPAEQSPAVATPRTSSEAKPLAELVPGPRWVSSIEASRYQAGRVYITLDGHKYDDDQLYVFVSEDFGKTWKSILNNVPNEAGFIHCLREDIKNENVLYLGCENSAWFSLDRGKSWTRFKGGFPSVAVHEFAQHQTSGELIAGTHGRSIWIADVTPLRQWNVEKASSGPQLYRPNTVVRWTSTPERGDNGPRAFSGQNPSRNAHLYYSLAANATQVTLEIVDIEGKVVRSFSGTPTNAGMHHVEWDMRPTPTRAAGGGPGGGQGGFGGGQGVPVGVYLVRLAVDGEVLSQRLTIERDPTRETSGNIGNAEEFEYFQDIDD
ncbi:MAG: PDZ domain-containing protein [Pirellulaceae bacterium]|nr:PDZ domain-containing protein [Pirellulaceae bacterium]